MAESGSAAWHHARKRPVEVEAWGPWDGTRQHATALANALSIPVWLGSEFPAVRGGFRRRLFAEIHGSKERIDPGDYIIRHPDGRLEPCKPDVFAETYEPVEDAPG